MIVMRCGNKSVVRVAQRVAALVLVQGLSSLPSNMYCLFNPSITFVRFSVQNSGGWPVDHMVIMRCMVSQCWFVLLRQTWCMLVFAPLQLASLLPETSMYQVCLSSSKGLESKTKTLTPGLETKTFRIWTRLLSRLETLVLRSHDWEYVYVVIMPSCSVCWLKLSFSSFYRATLC